MSELLPCPYCGNENVTLEFNRFRGFYYIDCGRYACNRTVILGYSTKEEAIEEWNKFSRNRRANGGN